MITAQHMILGAWVNPAPAGIVDGDPVSSWVDSSGNGFNATQTGTARPIYKTGILNGKPVVRFSSASSQFLSLGAGLSNARPVVVFAVMRGFNTLAYMPSIGSTINTENFGPYQYSNTWRYFGIDGVIYISNTITDTSWHILTSFGTDAGHGSGTEWHTDGTGVGPSYVAASSGANLNAIGVRGSDYGDGDIAEILVYGHLSSTEMANIEKYLGTKYGITVASGTAVIPWAVPGLRGWWKADAIGQVALVNDDAVDIWTDSSGNGHTATQSGSSRPTFKTNIVNGRPIVRFTTAGTSGLNFSTAISSASPFTLFAVYKFTNPNDGVVTLGPGSDYGPLGIVKGGGATGTYFWSREMYRVDTLDFSGAFHVYAMSCTATPSIDPYVDGILRGPTDITTAYASNFTGLGWRPFDGACSDADIAEIIFYNSALSSTDRTNIEKNLGTKYGITVAGGTAVDPSSISGLVGWWKADSLG